MIIYKQDEYIVEICVKSIPQQTRKVWLLIDEKLYGPDDELPLGYFGEVNHINSGRNLVKTFIARRSVRPGRWQNYGDKTIILAKNFLGITSGRPRTPPEIHRGTIHLTVAPWTQQRIKADLGEDENKGQAIDRWARLIEHIRKNSCSVKCMVCEEFREIENVGYCPSHTSDGAPCIFIVCDDCIRTSGEKHKEVSPNCPKACDYPVIRRF